MIRFEKKVLFIGYGAVARCTLPVFLKHVKVPMRTSRCWISRTTRSSCALDGSGVHFDRQRVTQENLGAVLGRYSRRGLADRSGLEHRLLRNLQWCHDHGVLYINTSIELGTLRRHPLQASHERTLYRRHLASASWPPVGAGREPRP